ncbi:cysteine hydrolase family protein [Phaeovulum sp. W22_SRMD_FR3]|uniref:cysteine hydrolase family protein n=1 Tax=Phaeovulum sp. W22_SRMD_FR3 TaxID=3240274 RepID=UPI003F9E0FA3
MTVAYLVVATALLGFGWLALGVWKIGAVSRGTPIAPRENTALLLIDLQSVFWDHGPYSDAAKQAAERAILREIAAARAQGHQIIALRQEWSIPSTKAIARLMMKGWAVEGSAGTALAEPFAGKADQVLVKRVQDAFETGALDAVLTKRGIGKLRIAGLDLNHCVLKTALAARNRGYEVSVVKEATLSAAQSDRAEAKMRARGVALR